MKNAALNLPDALIQSLGNPTIEDMLEHGEVLGFTFSLFRWLEYAGLLDLATIEAHRQKFGKFSHLRGISYKKDKEVMMVLKRLSDPSPSPALAEAINQLTTKYRRIARIHPQCLTFRQRQRIDEWIEENVIPQISAHSYNVIKAFNEKYFKHQQFGYDLFYSLFRFPVYTLLRLRNAGLKVANELRVLLNGLQAAAIEIIEELDPASVPEEDDINAKWGNGLLPTYATHLAQALVHTAETPTAEYLIHFFSKTFSVPAVDVAAWLLEQVSQNHLLQKPDGGLVLPEAAEKIG